MSPKYQALNQLTLRGIWLALEAFKDDPVEVVLFENVPRIATRGRHLLDQIVGLLRHYGYAVAETTHDCGELGGLAQSRKRFLLIARHAEKVPPFIYEPMKRPLRAVGEVLAKLPLPGDPAAGPMHRVPSLQWKTWVRLAFVEAGKDWRSLERLKVENGVLADFAIVPEWAMHNGVLGVNKWEEPSGTVASGSRPTNGKFSVADPRVDGHWKSVAIRRPRWKRTAGVVTSKMMVGGGAHSVADPRLDERGGRQNNIFRVVRWQEIGPTVTAGGHPTAGGAAVADPRVGYGANSHRNKLAVVPWASLRAPSPAARRSRAAR
jgi:site-specific DNA-cytosine methylase